MMKQLVVISAAILLFHMVEGQTLGKGGDPSITAYFTSCVSDSSLTVASYNIMEHISAIKWHQTDHI